MNSEKLRVVILGSTGSIGVNTLDVIDRHRDRFDVFALTASTSVEAMAAQCAKYEPTYAVMASEAHGQQLRALCESSGLRTRVLWGAEAITMVAGHEQADTVMAAIVGAAGLAPCLAAARSGQRLLLANKEALVVGGQLFMDAVAAGGATLLPIDSEHSAIFQSLPQDPQDWAARVDKIILTASGGPFRTRDPRTLRDVTPEEACAHPNWVMGRKISVDSATMMNKVLEVIEARFLFGMAPEKIEVVIHPQSVIHSMVQYVDHSVVAQLGTPDMRGPIAYGLSWPHRVSSGASALDFSSMASLTFEAVATDAHRQRFPGLALAWAVLNAPPGTPAVLNAANEVAVAAFLARRIRYDQIHQVNAEALHSVVFQQPASLDDLLALDQLSRRAAEDAIARFAP
ncbi:MAG: 1-deoxy-D-xylulose-5-phosphate reductoisomerase [Rhodoferax sp.]